MKSMDELTLHAYGLLDEAEGAAIRDHLATCETCAATSEEIRSEHRLFERAAEPDEVNSHEASERILSQVKRASRPRPSVPTASLAAAALLLAALAWALILRTPTRPPTPSAPAAPQASGYELDSLVAELKSATPLRREIATQALKAYGQEAAARLEAAGADATLISACRDGRPATPVRPVREHESAPVLMFALRTSDETKRGQAKAALAHLGFGAENVLWGALDAREGHVRDAAAELLRRLYTPLGDPVDHAPRIDMMRRIGHPVDEQDASLYDVLDRIRQRNLKLTDFDPAAEAAARGIRVTYRFEGSWYGHFTLLLDAAGMHFVAGRERVFIRNGERAHYPDAPIWLPPSEAKRVQTLVDALSSPDPKGEEEAWRGINVDRLEGQALASVRQATWLFEGPAKERACALRQKLLRRIFESDRADVVSGVELQVLDKRQHDLLQLRVDAKGKIEKILADAAVKCRILARPEGDRSVTLKGVRVVALLRALTHPYGLDFYMDGDTVVIDTAANVRQAVER